jgi:hypothetical protein
MKATSLSINLACPCPNKCPFCISHLTEHQGSHDRQNHRILESMPKAVDYCRYNGIDTVLITGRGEPMSVDHTVMRVIEALKRGGVPRVELQTSGVGLTDGAIAAMAYKGLSTVSISAASRFDVLNQKIMGHGVDFRELASKVAGVGMIPRLSLNLTRDDWDVDGDQTNYDIGAEAIRPRRQLMHIQKELPAFVRSLRSIGCRQLTLRLLGKPRDPKNSEAAQKASAWIDEHGAHDLHRYLDRVISDDASPVYRLDYGPIVWSYEGMSVVLVDCMPTKMEETGEIRSVVLQPDGLIHVGWQDCPIC